MRCLLVPTLLIALFAPPVLAQTASASSPDAEPTTEAARLAELERINEVLTGLQDQAMRDSEVQVEYGKLQQLVARTMDEIDPATPDRRARLLHVVDLLSETEGSGDAERYDELTAEGATLETQLRVTQQAAFAHEDVAPRLQQFQDTLFARMTQIDPATPTLVERAGELMEELP